MANSGSKRKKPTENMNLVLFEEVGGNCPKCTKPLMQKSKGQMIKLYEVAHIYPNSPRPHEIELLKNETVLNQNVDHEDNLIALCRDCHKIFDNPRTVEGYCEMVAIKRGLQRLSKLKNGWFGSTIDEEINEIVEALGALTETAIGGLEELSLEAMEVDSKSDATLKVLVKQKIKSHVKYFYSRIKSKFAELDKATPLTSDTIYSQVRAHYLTLKKAGLDQTQIFYALTDWLKNKTGGDNTEATEIIVSFFVQNCEVYS